jgi:hypothetical protein
MVKQSEKVAADKQPESQRGKSRFAVQPRPNRVVLPERPPREIDNEIVSILLGGDPTTLGAQDSEELTLPVVTASPSNARAEIIPLGEDSLREEKPRSFESAELIGKVETLPKSPSETHQTRAKDSQTRISPGSRVTTDRFPSKVERISSTPIKGISGQKTSLPGSNADKTSTANTENIKDLDIFSFEEFAERWKHGLRKGQLKVCEILYQKTYALGEVQCLTSFSELGRLSGLKMRQCFNIIAQLETLKFVERAKSEPTSNKRDQGSIIRFYLFPKS